MTRIRHIAIASREPAKAAEFYKEAFGWTEIARRARPDDPSKATAVTLSDGHVSVAIIDFNVDQIGKGPDYEGLHHIGVVIDDVDAWQDRLEDMGAPCIAGKDEIPPGAHFEIKFRAPADDVVFDISDRPWPGAAAMTEEEYDAARQRRAVKETV